MDHSDKRDRHIAARLPPLKPDAGSAGIVQQAHRVRAILSLAAKKFWQIDGGQWAGAFAFNAFFSLFPLIVLFVTIASSFIDRNRAGTEIIGFVEKYVPISGDMQRYIFDTLYGVVDASGEAGAVALLILVWVSIQCFTTLISATNRAWGVEEYNWWQMPIKSLVLFGVTAFTVLLGIAAPIFLAMAEGWLFSLSEPGVWVYGPMSYFIAPLMMFIGLILFYKFAPQRFTRLAEIWGGALGATILLWVTGSLFVIYLRDFATLNVVYGAFGGIMALLLWIYLSGCIFICGACLSAAQAEILAPPKRRRRKRSGAVG